MFRNLFSMLHFRKAAPMSIMSTPYNTTYQESTKMTPYEDVYGPNPLRMDSYLLGTLKVHVVDNTLHTIEYILCTLEDNLIMDQNRMKQ
jgi:hypothetical protein